MAFEQNSQVGKPNALLDSIVKHINSPVERQYTLLFKALFKGDAFWSFAEKHGGNLQYVRFKFTVPNMIFGAGGSVKAGLRRIGNDTDAEEIEVKIGSEHGIKADSAAVKEGVAYGEEGNAVVTALALNGERWSSTQRKLTKRIMTVVDFVNSKPKEVVQWLSNVLHGDADSISSRHGDSSDSDSSR